MITIITMTSGGAAERQRLAESFVQEKVLPQIEAEYHGHRQNLGSNMSSVAAVPGMGSVNEHWNENSKTVAEHEKNAGIRTDVPQVVEQRYVDTKDQLAGDGLDIEQGKKGVETVRGELDKAHGDAVKKHEEGFKNEVKDQNRIVGIKMPWKDDM